MQTLVSKVFRRLSLPIVVLLLAIPALGQTGAARPTPMLGAGTPATWLFIFKLNAAIFPSDATAPRDCAFGGTAQPYPAFSQRFVWASDASAQLQDGAGLVGTGASDPLGATFGEIYNGGFHFVVWNDQFYQHPAIAGCTDSCSSPWGHSKGIVAWNEAGEGVLLQVTTPSWPAAGGAANPRTGDGNTLGCVADNDVKVSQDFFSLKLSEPDLENVLDALANASVVTDVSNPQLVNNGGPAAIQKRVSALGRKSSSQAVLKFTLSTGVGLISKPSALPVPAWQLVSAELGGVDLRVATWWTSPAIPSTTSGAPPVCWSAGLIKPGAVQIATSGKWAGKVMSLKGGPATDGNHAKIGVTTAAGSSLTIFGDMNQQGALSGRCSSSQNGRGGLFFVVNSAPLHDSVAAMITGDSASSSGPMASVLSANPAADFVASARALKPTAVKRHAQGKKIKRCWRAKTMTGRAAHVVCHRRSAAAHLKKR
jgi:hypothetical protein